MVTILLKCGWNVNIVSILQIDRFSKYTWEDTLEKMFKYQYCTGTKPTLTDEAGKCAPKQHASLILLNIQCMNPSAYSNNRWKVKNSVQS